MKIQQLILLLLFGLLAGGCATSLSKKAVQARQAIDIMLGQEVSVESTNLSMPSIIPFIPDINGGVQNVVVDENYVTVDKLDVNIGSFHLDMTGYRRLREEQQPMSRALDDEADVP